MLYVHVVWGNLKCFVYDSDYSGRFSVYIVCVSAAVFVV